MHGNRVLAEASNRLSYKERLTIHYKIRRSMVGRDNIFKIASFRQLMILSGTLICTILKVLLFAHVCRKMRTR